MYVPYRGMPTSAFDVSLVAAQYRSCEFHSFFKELNARISMLHPDVLALLYHFGANIDGPVLELGPCLGGSTVALARGLMDAAGSAKVTSVEVGGKYDHPTYATDNILLSLGENLERYGVAKRVNVIAGNSRDTQVVRAVSRVAASDGLFQCIMIDTDGLVEDDLKLYRPLLGPRCFLVVDDYYAPGAPWKEATTRPQLDRMRELGVVETFGVYGWGTWFGRFI